MSCGGVSDGFRPASLCWTLDDQRRSRILSRHPDVAHSRCKFDIQKICSWLLILLLVKQKQIALTMGAECTVREDVPVRSKRPRRQNRVGFRLEHDVITADWLTVSVAGAWNLTSTEYRREHGTQPVNNRTTCYVNQSESPRNKRYSMNGWWYLFYFI